MPNRTPTWTPELTAKTKALLRLHSQTQSLEPPGMIRELGPQELAALKASSLNDAVKVLSLQKILAAKVAQDGAALEEPGTLMRPLHLCRGRPRLRDWHGQVTSASGKR